MRSRQLNKVMKFLMSQPEDDLSSHSSFMSRQTIICRDMKEKFTNWVAFNCAQNLMTAHNFSFTLKSRQAKINGIINSQQ